MKSASTRKVLASLRAFKDLVSREINLEAVAPSLPPHPPQVNCMSLTCYITDTVASKSISNYSQLSPCGHLAVTDTPLVRTKKRKKTPAITDLRTLCSVPTTQFYCCNSRYNGQQAEFFNTSKTIISYFRCLPSFLPFWLHSFLCIPALLSRRLE